MTKKLNSFQIGELVEYDGKEGVVIYSNPVFNDAGVRLTIMWNNGLDEIGYKREFVDHLNCIKIKNPSQELIEFGKREVTNEWKDPEGIYSNLDYLAAMRILNKYKRMITQ